MKKILALFLAICASAAFAQKNVKELTFAVNEHAAEKKVATALAIQIFSNIGIRLNVIPMPGDKANRLAINGEVDGEVARIAVYTENNPSLVKVEPSYYGFVSTAFVKTDRGIKINKKEDLSKFVCGYSRGIAHAQKMCEGAKNVVVADNYDHLFKLLATGKIDVALDSKINGLEQINKFGLGHMLSAAKELAVFDEFVILAKHQHLATVVGSEIKRLRDNGELGLLAKKYEDMYFPQK